MSNTRRLAESVKQSCPGRRRLLALRTDGTIGDAAFQRIQEELDWAELDWSQLLQAGAKSEENG